jgi:CPA2 family monovalent cation:H+ antiporter-2
MSAHDFLKALTVVLCTAGVTIVLFERLKQPVVLGYILAGMIVGPHVPIPLVVDPQIVLTLSELGVVLLMFSLGLEFSLSKLGQVLPTAGLTAVVQSSIMVWLGFLAGRLFGWTLLESVFTGAIVAISSTTIIAKAFDEQGIHGHLRGLVVGILIVEDLIAILLMAILTALSSGEGFSLETVAESGGRLMLFLAGALTVGMLIVPRVMRAIARAGRPETTLVVSIGICFGAALLAHELGYSVALGAFIAGSLVAESGEGATVEHLVHPVRDMFAAIFFVSVGMMIDPAVIVRHWVEVVALTGLVVAGKIAGVSLGAFLSGHGTRTSLRAGMSLAQIGEFSFIIAGLGASLGATGDTLYPVAVAVSALTTLTTPWLIRASDRTASAIDARLPAPLQTFAALYGRWIEQIRTPSSAGPRASASREKRLVRLLLLDAAILAAIIIGAAVYADDAVAWLQERVELSRALGRWSVVIAAMLVGSPFFVGLTRLARQVGFLLADAALPTPSVEAADQNAAPRRTLAVALQVSVVLLVGLPVLAITQPFLPGASSAIVLVLFLVVMGVAFWRSASDLEGHVRAGATNVLALLASQSHASTDEKGPNEEPALAHTKLVLAGLGEPVPFVIGEGTMAEGRSLAELNLRGRTGVIVLAIRRGEGNVLVPDPSAPLHPGDVLALAGTREAIDAGRELLSERSAHAS